MNLDFSTRTQDDIIEDFEKFIWKIDKFRMYKSKCTKEYTTIDDEIEQTIRNAIIDWTYSGESLAVFLDRLLCGEDAVDIARKLCKELASIKFSYLKEENKQEYLPLENYKDELINEIKFIAKNKFEEYYNNPNSVLKVMSTMYAAIINCLSEEPKTKKSGEEIYREKFKKKRDGIFKR